MKNYIAFFLIFPFVLNAQNLVKNPSFENHSICPTDSEQLNGYVDGWNTYFSTPDYLNQCGYYPWWVGDATPRTGDGVVFALWFNLVTHKQRECLHGDLVQPLSAGKTYYLEFYIYTLSHGVAIAQLQAHFTEEIID
ncbi:MAG TPA: hypothetical protein ENJ53_08955, partial [Phaeodactylibacter sp.]|nr:hypothetical protein [Phaeodactylibacter sp.]